MNKCLLVPTKGMQGERALRKTATRGVVALFNAVRQHQRRAEDLEEESVTLRAAERRKAQELSSQKFLAALKKGKVGKTGVTVGTSGSNNDANSSQTTNDDEEEIVEDEEEKRSYEGIAASAPGGFLDEKLLLGAKMKDWDKDSSDEEDEKEV
eukprot:g867.t1